MWCARTDTWASKHVFYYSSDVSPVDTYCLATTPKQRQNRSFSHFAHRLWVMICFGMHEFKLGHGALHTFSHRLQSLCNSQKFIHEFVSSCSHRLVDFTHGTLFTESCRCISIDPTLLIIDGCRFQMMMCKHYNVLHNLLSCFSLSSGELLM